MPNVKVGNQYLIIDTDECELLKTLEDVKENLAEKDDDGNLDDDTRVFEIVRELKVKKEFKIYEK